MMAAAPERPAVPFAARLEACRGCEQRVDLLLSRGIAPGAPVGLTHRCNLCKCFLQAKARLEGQHCPQGKW